MPDEQTPLIHTVVVTRREPRYSGGRTFRRFCTIALSCLLIVLIVSFILPFTVARHRRPHDPNHHWGPPPQVWPQSQGLKYSELEDILYRTPDPSQARAWSEYYTSGPHLAGKNLSQAVWTRERWEEFGVRSEIVSYDVYINYPVSHRLALYEKRKLVCECNLTEDELDEDPTTRLTTKIPTFHGYSASGNVTASLVYVNFGTYWDFEDLVDRNVSLKGNIAIAKYGRNFRGLKVKRAQELGMVGVLIYSDPQEDGETTEVNGFKTYPDGPARNPSAVQRGSVQFLSIAPGDPTTPGYPSKPGVPRVNPHGSIPEIPSLPLSYQDALPLLKALNGHGPKASEFNEFWQGGGLEYKGVEYNIGPTPADVVVNLVNEQEYVTTPLWNVIGIINGTIPDEVIIIGNHRDAWIAGGAGDPNSGSAALNEVIRSFGRALEAGWKPLRTIVFASWDGEEYGLIGSTEWVEEFLPWLSKSTIAYLNVDVCARGTQFHSSASPLLNRLLYNVTSRVESPLGGTIRDHWDGTITTMGSGSDFTAFQDFAGVASLDVGYLAGSKDPVYHYHSNYDSFWWMDHFGDKGWHHHVAVARLLALMTAKLSETPILPLNATDYAVELHRYIDSVKAKVGEDSPLKKHLDFDNLYYAVDRLRSAAQAFDRYAAELGAAVQQDMPWWKWWKKVKLYYDVRKANTKYKLLEPQFLFEEGLDERSWFKHVVFAPGRWTGYAGATFPSLVENIEDGNLTSARRWSSIIEQRLDAAASTLE